MSNLLPKNQKKAILGLYRKRFLGLLFLAIFLVAAASIMLMLPSFFFEKTSETLLTQKRDMLAGHETNKIAQTLASSIKDVNGRLGVFSETMPASPLLASFIDPVLRAKGPTIHIAEFVFTGDGKQSAKIQISGRSANREDLLAFVGALKTINGFSAVNLPIASFIEDKNVSFTISAAVALK